MNSHRSRVHASLILGFLMGLMTTSESFSQGYTSPISWHHIVYETRVSALGQSTAALDNGTAYQLNPAIPFENGVLTASSFLFLAKAFESFAVPNGANLYSPTISFSLGKFSYSAQLNHTSYSTSESFGNEDYSNRFMRLNIGYQISEKISVGAGFMQSSYKSPVVVLGGEEYGGDATAWGLNAGAYYQDEFESNHFRFMPQAGVSLNDLSNGFEYETGYSDDTNLPGQVRLGLGVNMYGKHSLYDRSLYGAGIYTGFSKYLARMEYDDEQAKRTYPSGFEGVFTTWNSFKRFNGSQMEEISLGEQISTSIGFELHFLETLYLRYGIIGGSDYWIRPQHGFGAEVDLFYISISASHQNYHSSDQWPEQDNSISYQAKIKIPIDGKSRDTLVGRLFK